MDDRIKMPLKIQMKHLKVIFNMSPRKTLIENVYEKIPLNNPKSKPLSSLKNSN